MCAVFSCFSNPPNSDIVYRIINVRTLFFYLYVYTRGWGTQTRSQHNILTRKICHTCLCSGRGSNLYSWTPLDLVAYALPIEPPRHPRPKHDTPCMYRSTYHCPGVCAHAVLSFCGRTNTLQSGSSATTTEVGALARVLKAIVIETQ